jgi:glycosyltransferase involved in cell wall biosynthesis
VGGLPEIVEEGVTGFLFTSGDVAGLADRMAYLIQNPKYMTQIREQAPTVLRSRFNYLSMLKRYELVYEQSSEV